MHTPGQDNSSIKQAWLKFMQSGIIHPIVRPVIAESWRRSYQAGVDPFCGVHHHNSLIEPQLDELLEKQRDFIDIARKFMYNIYHFVKGPGFVVILSDKNGYIMKIMGDILC